MNNSVQRHAVDKWGDLTDALWSIPINSFLTARDAANLKCASRQFKKLCENSLRHKQLIFLKDYFDAFQPQTHTMGEGTKSLYHYGQCNREFAYKTSQYWVLFEHHYHNYIPPTGSFSLRLLRLRPQSLLFAGRLGHQSKEHHWAHGFDKKQGLLGMAAGMYFLGPSLIIEEDPSTHFIKPFDQETGLPNPNQINVFEHFKLMQIPPEQWTLIHLGQTYNNKGDLDQLYTLTENGHVSFWNPQTFKPTNDVNINIKLSKDWNGKERPIYQVKNTLLVHSSSEHHFIRLDDNCNKINVTKDAEWRGWDYNQTTAVSQSAFFLRHGNKIFCIGTDTQLNWSFETPASKQISATEIYVGEKWVVVPVVFDRVDDPILDIYSEGAYVLEAKTGRLVGYFDIKDPMNRWSFLLHERDATILLDDERDIVFWQYDKNMPLQAIHIPTFQELPPLQIPGRVKCMKIETRKNKLIMEIAYYHLLSKEEFAKREEERLKLGEPRNAVHLEDRLILPARELRMATYVNDLVNPAPNPNKEPQPNCFKRVWNWICFNFSELMIRICNCFNLGCCWIHPTSDHT